MTDLSSSVPAPAAYLQSLPPYTPIEPFEVLSARLNRPVDQIVKLDANENPYGPSPRVRQALATLAFLHIYPDPESRKLRQALSQFTGVPDQFLMAGAGADELIDLLLRVMLEPGDRVLSCPPTFGMYAFDVQLNAGQLTEITRQADFSLNLPAIQAVVERLHPKILFLASPNNPDGSLLSPQMLTQLLDLPVLVVLDEAYIEFCDDSRLGQDRTWIRQVQERRNLVVLRTFSKWAGLAGLRVGYGAFPEWLLPTLWKAKQPYNINVAASAAAIASLEDAPYLAQVVDRIQHERRQLAQALAAFPFLQPYPSQANFILCKVTEKVAAELKSYLAEEHGVFIRYFDKPGLQDHIRISVGRPEDTRRLLTALQEYGDRE